MPRSLAASGMGTALGPLSAEAICPRRPRLSKSQKGNAPCVWKGTYESGYREQRAKPRGGNHAAEQEDAGGAKRCLCLAAHLGEFAVAPLAHARQQVLVREEAVSVLTAGGLSSYRHPELVGVVSPGLYHDQRPQGVVSRGRPSANPTCVRYLTLPFADSCHPPATSLLSRRHRATPSTEVPRAGAYRSPGTTSYRVVLRAAPVLRLVILGAH